MDRHTRKELKTDKFAQGVGSGFEFLSHHRGQAARYSLIGVAVVALAGGYWLYRGHQTTLRTDLLSKAMLIDEAAVGPPQPPKLSFPTAEEKEKARLAAFTDVAAKYPGSQEGAIAQLVFSHNNSWFTMSLGWGLGLTFGIYVAGGVSVSFIMLICL